MASYTLPYQRNEDLDYGNIQKTCHKTVEEMIDWDNRVHQMDSQENKGLIYFFRYLKKNLFLIAALDRQCAEYEEEMKEKFVKFH